MRIIFFVRKQKNILTSLIAESKHFVTLTFFNVSLAFCSLKPKSLNLSIVSSGDIFRGFSQNLKNELKTGGSVAVADDICHSLSMSMSKQMTALHVLMFRILILK